MLQHRWQLYHTRCYVREEFYKNYKKLEYIYAHWSIYINIPKE